MPRIYRPTVGVGLPMAHVAVLSSPAVKAFFKNADIPQRFSKVTNCFCAAMNPDELRSDMSGDEKTTRYPIIWDSGATTSISPYKDDFVGKLEPAPLGLKLRGIASGLKIEGIGHVARSVVDTTGMLRTIKVPALYVPSATARLLSTSSLLQTYTDESISMNADHLQLSGSDKTNPVHVDHDPSTNLPTSLAYSHGTTPNRFDAFASIITSTLESNHNLSPAEKEHLRWHHRLGHLNFSQIQFLLRTGVLAYSESARRLQAAASRITTYPLCPACQFGKQRRRPSPGKTSRVPSSPPQPTPPPAHKPQPTPTSKPAPLPSATRTSRRSNKAQPPKRFGYNGRGPAGYNAPLKSQSPETNNFYTYFSAYFNHSNIDLEHSHDCSFIPSSYKARATKDPDVFTYNEAVNGPNSEKWTAAAKKEIEELEGKLTWIEVPMSKAKTKIIPGTWVFRVKRNPSGEMTKFKARYCVRGDLEEMDVDENTFAPTVAWSTVRLFLVLCLILGWATISVDFSNAFVQSKLDKPKWVHLPRGFVSPKGKDHAFLVQKTRIKIRLFESTLGESFHGGLIP
ncbi:unnamed protein product [Cylindrotheca closterium]|uniref:Reverse transcriptase Ty1/copia-type domain-containing protein n=1 Tax=Cylindrotheca closterium TaxID=2856 RepID=A0AAD2CM31_9STRA|nr:unnamed protein product [Cylindrotheca closterium]